MSYENLLKTNPEKWKNIYVNQINGNHLPNMLAPANHVLGATGLGSLSWFSTSIFKGDTGDTGPTGPQGDPGGPTGPQGDTGSQGVTGPQGIQGDTGDQGLKGDTGDQGIQGDTGSQGIQGDTGDQGVQGDTGSQGIQGDTGEQGIQGDTGEQGIPGDTGEQGIPGDTGPTGPINISNKAFMHVYDDSGYTLLNNSIGSYDLFNAFPGSTGITLVSNTNLQVDQDGVYLITYSAGFDNTGVVVPGGRRESWILVNGFSISERYGYCGMNNINDELNALTSSVQLSLSAGDYITLVLYQNSGGSLTVWQVSLQMSLLFQL